MAEYIEREALIADIEKRYCRPCEAEGKDYNHVRCRACWVDDMLGEIGDAPFYDVVPVVRCKDCVVSYCVDYEDIVCGRTCVNVDADDFCSYGERKDGDGNG